MIRRARKYFQTAVKLFISGAALYYVLSNTDLNSLVSLMRKSNAALLTLALLFFVLSKIISAYRLNLFFKAEGIIISNSVNLKLYWLGMYYNLFLPGGIGGDGYKVYYLKNRLDAPVKKSILVVLFDRVTGVLALAFLCLLLIVFIPELKSIGYLSLIPAVLLVLSFYLVVNKWFRQFYPFLNRTNIQSLLVQLSQLICAFLILSSLGEHPDIFTYLFVFLISSIVAVVPFTIGGIGARELTFLYAARLLDLNIAVSVSLSLLFFLITAVVSLGGMPFSLRTDWIGKRQVV